MLRLNNYARFVEERGGSPYYEWRVFVDEPKSVLDSMEEVEYTLHPTFPKPKQTRTDPSDGFALNTAGWGEFTILANVKFKDGRSERAIYWLDLSKPWPAHSNN